MTKNSHFPTIYTMTKNSNLHSDKELETFHIVCYNLFDENVVKTDRTVNVLHRWILNQD